MSMVEEITPRLDYDRNVPVRFYLQAYPYWSEYRLECLQLLFEAKRAFEHHCPTASTIVSGEALMRALCDRVLYFLPDDLVIGKKPKKIRQLIAESGYEELLDMRFCDIIDALEQTNRYGDDLIQLMRDVKDIRNEVVHAGTPLLDLWDTNVPDHDFKALLEQDYEFPEAYRVLIKRGKGRWVSFDCGKYNCSLKHLDNASRIAAIQFHLTLTIIDRLSTGPLGCPEGGEDDLRVYHDLLSPQQCALDKASEPSPRRVGAKKLIVCAREMGYYTSISEAIRDANSGDQIEVRPGHYQECLTITKNIEIVGAGHREDITLQADGNCCVSVRAEEVMIRGLTLRGRNGNKHRECRTIEHVTGKARLEDCDIQSFRGYCVVVAGPAAFPIMRGCTLRHGRHSLVFQEGTTGIIEDCTIQDSENVGIDIGQDANPVIRNCSIYDSGQSAIIVRPNGRGVIDACVLERSSYTHMVIYDRGNPPIQQCTLRRHRETSGNGTERESPSVASIYVGQGGQGTIERCTFQGSKRQNIVLEQPCSTIFQDCQYGIA